MDPNSFKTLQLLEAISENRSPSQRELAQSLQMSLGLVNAFIKRLVRKGYCKVTTVPKNRVKYILTPAGAMEKTRLTYQYIHSSYQYFKAIQKRLRDLYHDLQSNGATRVVFYGADELAEIALTAMSGTRVRLIDVVDPDREGEVFAGLKVKKSVSTIRALNYDALVITLLDDHEIVLKSLIASGVPRKKVRFFA